MKSYSSANGENKWQCSKIWRKKISAGANRLKAGENQSAESMAKMAYGENGVKMSKIVKK
jgi:hypothetical protein